MFLLPSGEFGLAPFALAPLAAVRDDHAGDSVAAIGDITVVLPTAAFAPGSSHALQSSRFPGKDRPRRTASASSRR